jgi:hypothetical protein
MLANPILYIQTFQDRAKVRLNWTLEAQQLRAIPLCRGIGCELNGSDLM